MHIRACACHLAAVAGVTHGNVLLSGFYFWFMIGCCNRRSEISDLWEFGGGQDGAGPGSGQAGAQASDSQRARGADLEQRIIQQPRSD
jgi:hypothetical protein